MSKLWMTGEVQADVAVPFQKARKAVEHSVNQLIQEIPLGGKVEEWIFIAIIRQEDHPYYEEVVKKSSRGKALEFRLKIAHAEFLSASPNGQIRSVLKALLRSVTLMNNLGVSAETQLKLSAVLSRAEFELLGSEARGPTN